MWKWRWTPKVENNKPSVELCSELPHAPNVVHNLDYINFTLSSDSTACNTFDYIYISLMLIHRVCFTLNDFTNGICQEAHFWSQSEGLNDILFSTRFLGFKKKLSTVLYTVDNTTINHGLADRRCGSEMSNRRWMETEKSKIIEDCHI